MQVRKWASILIALIMIGACFFPWVSFNDPEKVVSGFYSDVSTYGRPGIVHVWVCSIYVILVLWQQTRTLLAAFFINLLNIIWAVRNFILITACSNGYCPSKHVALYILMIGSFVLTGITLTLSAAKNQRREPKIENTQ